MSDQDVTRCRHGVWIADHCFKCEAEGQPTEEIPKALVSDERLAGLLNFYQEINSSGADVCQELQQWRKWAAAKGGR